MNYTIIGIMLILCSQLVFGMKEESNTATLSQSKKSAKTEKDYIERASLLEAFLNQAITITEKNEEPRVTFPNIQDNSQMYSQSLKWAKGRLMLPVIVGIEESSSAIIISKNMRAFRDLTDAQKIAFILQEDSRKWFTISEIRFLSFLSDTVEYLDNIGLKYQHKDAIYIKDDRIKKEIELLQEPYPKLLQEMLLKNPDKEAFEVKKDFIKQKYVTMHNRLRWRKAFLHEDVEAIENLKKQNIYLSDTGESCFDYQPMSKRVRDEKKDSHKDLYNRKKKRRKLFPFNVAVS